ncbi:MAG TPA: ribosome assembly RNA-binding protein YhbY [Burkholderiales bacterium]|nr:ribosome assembly RNA-binding protein YhbY [Burkholderiales bacterium]
MKELTSAERRALRARAHHLKPVVIVGDAGLTPEVAREIDVGLKSHELIKIRVSGEERGSRKELILAICEATGAQPVQHIGKILVVYRPRPEEPEEAPRRRAKRKAPRRTKRSYQNT